MALTLDTALTVALIISSSIWIGGVATVIIVTLVSRRTLAAETRIEFSRAFGIAFFAVAGPALVITMLIGWTFLTRQEWSTELTRMAFASGLLFVVLAAGIVQARGLTRIRWRLTRSPNDGELANTVEGRAIAATILRTLIVILTLGLTVQAAAQLTSVLR